MKRCYRTKTARYGLIGAVAFSILYLVNDIWGPPRPTDPHPLSVTAKMVFSAYFLCLAFLVVRVVPAGAYPRADGLKVQSG